MKINALSVIFPESYRKTYQLNDRSRKSRSAGIITFILLIFFQAQHVSTQTKYPLSAEDIYASDIPIQNTVRLTCANPWIEKEVQLGKSEVLRWKSTDGTEIEGVFIFPVNHQKGRKAPLILDIHGGPNGYWGNEFDPFFQVYAGVGYAVLGINVRGSSGYGDVLENLGIETTVAHPKEVRTIAKAKVKTDERDSYKLAHLLRTGYIPEVHKRSRENRSCQRVLRQRAFYVGKQTSAICGSLLIISRRNWMLK